MIPAAISEYLDRHHAQWSLLGHPAAYIASPEELHALKSEHRGETYYFCSQSCKMEFNDNPYAYA